MDRGASGGAEVGAMSFMFRILRKRASLVFSKPSTSTDGANVNAGQRATATTKPPPPPPADHELIWLNYAGGGGSFNTLRREPTSPEVSCMGRIKRSGGKPPGRKEKRLQLAVWEFLIISVASRRQLRTRRMLPRMAKDVDGASAANGLPVPEVLLDVEPRKEVNLWKRRVVAPPPPLQLY